MLLFKDKVDTIYISGPMTGLPDMNFPNFQYAEMKLLNDGWKVESPTEHGIVKGATWEDYMAACLIQIAQCDTMYMLRGWENSKGAREEYRLAELLGLEVYFQEVEHAQ